MRLLLYNAILARLAHIREVDGIPVYIASETEDLPPQAIKTFDLWNENVTQLTQQSPFVTPAVFVEFLPIVWQQSGRKAKYADVDVRLHIVTATLATTASPYKEQAFYRFSLARAIGQALVGYTGAADENGRHFGSFTQTESQTDHEHEQVCEDIETWTTRCFDCSAVGRDLITTPSNVTLRQR